MTFRGKTNAALSIALLWIYSICWSGTPCVRLTTVVSAFATLPIASRSRSTTPTVQQKTSWLPETLWIVHSTNNDNTIDDQSDATTATTTTTSSSTVVVANSLHGRLLCASTCAYYDTKDLQTNKYLQGAGFLPGTSLKRLAPRSGLDACLIGQTQDGIVVAFRGTSGNALEWLQNASIYLRNVPKSLAPKGCRVHEGFYGALKSSLEQGVKKSLRELLETTEEPTKIYITGHSKGGSLASMFALMLHQDDKFPNPELVCSFGAARIGNQAFGEYFDSVVNQVTYENDLDIIPFLPPGEATMKSIETSTEDPTAMMEMIESILGSDTNSKTIPKPKRKWRLPSFLLRRRNTRKFWTYSPIGRRVYIDASRNLISQVDSDLDAERIQNLESTTFRDLRRAHCSSCSDADDRNGDFDLVEQDMEPQQPDESEATCNGGYFAALAPEICESTNGL